MVRHLKLEKSFIFTGHITQEVLLRYYQNATIYVLPSYREGLPTTLLEAMSCGLPVVATRIPGITDVISEIDNGLLVPPNNPCMLAKAISTLLDDKNLREAIARNSRKRIKDNYDWDAITNKVEEVYRSCLLN